MSTPQDPARRLKQKRRRSTQLAAWRAKQATTAAPATEKTAKAAPEKAAPAKAAPAKAAPAKA